MTAAQLRRDRWVVMARCPYCHLDCWVDLTTVIRLNGGEVVLWNRRPRCRRYACPGRMVFLVTPPGEPLGCFWPLHDPIRPKVRDDDPDL